MKNASDGLFDVTGRFHWQLKDLKLTSTKGAKYSCYVISGLRTLPSDVKSFQFPKSGLDSKYMRNYIRYLPVLAIDLSYTELNGQ